VTARDEFTRLVQQPGDTPVAEAALWIAAENEPVDVATSLALLGALATSARPAVDAAASWLAKIEALNHFLFAECGFEGSREDYYDPRNSFLNDVLERRVGIPITLSIVYVEVARRLGFDADGVGFPGHFLAIVRGEQDVLVDAFEGVILSEEDCAAKLRASMGKDAAFGPELLKSASSHDILLRMLNNLKQIYFQKQDWESALACCDRMLLLFPDMPLELRDRGLLYQRLECFGAALPDLERFLELAPQHQSAHGVRTALEALRQKAGQLH
jgi:regulator of sirC expression with transglutaminase-like and TPR domain